MSRSALRFIACVAAAIFLPLSAAGQQTSRTMSMPRTVHGQVRFAHGGGPAQHVIVRLERFHGGVWAEVITDVTGKYEFSGMTPEIYIINIRHPGYLEQRREVDLQSVNSAYELFQLVPDRLSSTGNSTPPTKVISANVPAEAMREFDRGEAALAQGSDETSLQEAVQHWEKAVRIYPGFLEAHLRLGTAYMDLKQWDKSEQALKKALEVNPKTVNASFALGEIYLRQKKYDEAEKSLQQGLSIETKSARAHLTLARVYWEEVIGVKDEAQWRSLLEKSYQQVKQAIELDPNLADAHLLKGSLYFKARRPEEALHEFEAYLRLDPKGPFAEQTRINVGKIKKALTETKKP